MAHYFCANKKRIVFYNKKKHIENVARLMGRRFGYIRQLLKAKSVEKTI